MTRTLFINLKGEAAHCNSWPFINIYINSNVEYSGIVKEELTLNIKFESKDTNIIILSYQNKKFGPNQWDTITDELGNIIKDQHIEINNIKIDECNLNFLISDLEYEINDGRYIKPNGYLGFNGSLKISFNEPYYDWVHETRLRLSKSNKNNILESSLPFVTSYVYNHDNKTVANLLNQLQETVNATKKFNFNSAIS